MLPPEITFHDNILTYYGRTINCLEVRGIRYGYTPIRLDMWTIGTRWFIDLITDKEELRMQFKIWFGIRKKSQYDTYWTLLNTIWDATVLRLYDELITKTDAGEIVPVGDCLITPDG